MQLWSTGWQSLKIGTQWWHFVVFGWELITETTGHHFLSLIFQIWVMSTLQVLQLWFRDFYILQILSLFHTHADPCQGDYCLLLPLFVLASSICSWVLQTYLIYTQVVGHSIALRKSIAIKRTSIHKTISKIQKMKSISLHTEYMW